MANNNNEQVGNPQNNDDIEPYKLSELFNLIPEYDGDQILLNAFLNSCDTAHEIATIDQRVLLVVHIKNKLRGKASQLINSRNVREWNDIRNLLVSHFGDPRDLSSLIHDLHHLKQNTNESALSFIHRLQAHNAKLLSSIAQQPNLTPLQRIAQINLIETMCLDTLLTGLDPKLGAIVRASNPANLVDACLRVKRESQLEYLETQRNPRSAGFNQNKTFIPKNRPNPNKPSFYNQNFHYENDQRDKQFCNYCKKPGHTFEKCFKRQNKNRPNGFNSNQNRAHGQAHGQAYGQTHNQTQNQGQNFQNRPQFQNSNRAHYLNENLEQLTTGNFVPMAVPGTSQQQQTNANSVNEIITRFQNTAL